MSFTPVIHSKDCYEKYLLDKKYKRRVEIFTNYGNPNYIKKDNNSFYILDLVPESWSFRMCNSDVIKHANRWDLILTWDKEILEKCKNSIEFLFGTTWILQEQIKYVEENKIFSISFVCGNKNQTKGHILRREIWDNQINVFSPKEFFISGQGNIPSVDKNLVLDPYPFSKYKLFFSQFHIAIENETIDNYFSEKLIDCFITKTIPIYYGANNIGDFFDIRGMFIVKNLKDTIRICNLLTENTYNEMKLYIDINYEKSKKYWEPYGDRVFKLIDKLNIDWRQIK